MTIIGRKAWEAICAVEGIAPLKPGEPLPTTRVTIGGTLEKQLLVARFAPSTKSRWPCRKHISDKACPDDICMPGLNGRCVACGDEK